MFSLRRQSNPCGGQISDKEVRRLALGQTVDFSLSREALSGRIKGISL